MESVEANYNSWVYLALDVCNKSLGRFHNSTYITVKCIEHHRFFICCDFFACYRISKLSFRNKGAFRLCISHYSPTGYRQIRSNKSI